MFKLAFVIDSWIRQCQIAWAEGHMKVCRIQQLQGALQKPNTQLPKLIPQGLWTPCSFCVLLAALLQLSLPVSLQAQYVYTTNNGSLTITKYTGSGGAVTIPAAISGLPVTAIADFAFYSLTNLTSVTISQGITNIGFEAFYSCSRLSSVSIPTSISSIGDWAFQNCTNLTQIIVVTLNPTYSSLNGVLLDKSQMTLVSYPAGKAGSYAMPGTVTNIGVGAFGGCLSLTSVSMSNKVMNIGDSAFYSCTRLGSVTVPDAVTNIGNSAFYSCTSLTSATLGNGVRSIGDYAFSSCNNLVGATIGSNVTSIGYGAFSGSGLTNLTIPNSVSKVGDAAFEYCSNLTSISIGNGLTSIPNFAFDACTSLTRITMGNAITNIGVDAFGRCARLASVTIPSSVTNIADAAFLNCTSLKSVYFLGNAPEAGGSVFGGDSQATVYYLAQTSGWGPTFGGLPTAFWNPQIQTGDSSFGVKANQFGFNIIGPSNLAIVVEACTNLASPIWSPVQTNVLTGGSAFFGDPKWTNYRARYYRVRLP